MGVQEKCGKSLKPKVHMCKLKKDGKSDEIETQTLKPIVFCSKCKAKAADPGYLCNPRALKSQLENQDPIKITHTDLRERIKADQAKT